MAKLAKKEPARSRSKKVVARSDSSQQYQLPWFCDKVVHEATNSMMFITSENRSAPPHEHTQTRDGCNAFLSTLLLFKGDQGIQRPKWPNIQSRGYNIISYKNYSSNRVYAQQRNNSSRITIRPIYKDYYLNQQIPTGILLGFPPLPR